MKNNFNVDNPVRKESDSPKIRPTSKISSLITSMPLKSLEDDFNENQSFAPPEPNIVGKKIVTLNVHYVLPSTNWENPQTTIICINQNATVASLISCVLDSINEELENYLNNTVRMNNDIDNYEIRFANKNKSPNFSIESCSRNSKVQKLNDKCFCLVWKNKNFGNYLISKEIPEKWENPSSSFEACYIY